MEEDKASSEAPTTASGKKKKVGQPSAAEETASPYPDMDLCQEIHQLTVKAHNVDADFQTKVFKEVAIELENPSLYSLMQSKLGVDGGVLSESARLALEEKHKKHLEELEAKVEEAKENAGDMEVMDARVEIAKFAAKSLTKEQALESYKKLLDLPKISSGKKIDALMESSRVASFYGDASKSAEMIDSAQKLATEGGGGDWDRRNRLKVYRGLSRLLERDIKGAASLLIDCIATFSCNEICSYKSFIVYAIMSNLLYLPRPQIKQKLLDGPEVLSIASDIPEVVSKACVASFFVHGESGPHHFFAPDAIGQVIVRV